MGYELHIEGCTQKQIQRAVDRVEGLRTTRKAVTATNPHTGETITVGGGRLLGVEFCIDGDWVPGFRLRGRRLTISAAFDPKQPVDPIAGRVFDLAEALKKPLVGDEGEEYARP